MLQTLQTWSYFISWKAVSNMTFNLTKGQGQDREKGQIHLIVYNIGSNCHRDFKLGSCFSLWKAAPNVTLTLKTSLQFLEWWNIQGLIATFTSGNDSILNRQGQRSFHKLAHISGIVRNTAMNSVDNIYKVICDLSNDVMT